MWCRWDFTSVETIYDILYLYKVCIKEGSVLIFYGICATILFNKF